jgi:hypothetical protein
MDFKGCAPVCSLDRGVLVRDNEGMSEENVSPVGNSIAPVHVAASTNGMLIAACRCHNWTSCECTQSLTSQHLCDSVFVSSWAKQSSVLP